MIKSWRELWPLKHLHNQINSVSYGSALKTARATWKKDGTELGNLVILFHCSFRYESYSNTEKLSKWQ